MPYRVYSVPNFTNTGLDLVFCDPQNVLSKAVVHYAFTVGADKDPIGRRSMELNKIQDFIVAYKQQHPEIYDRLLNQQPYRPGESVLDCDDGPSFNTEHETIFRLGALELLGNISSGRIAPTEKDPFPHQLALQQHVRQLTSQSGVRRLLIADEVGLGKTIEAGLILRDILLARGSLDGFSCLYLTSGGLVDDAVEKLGNILNGSIDNRNIVSPVLSFRRFGEGVTSGVFVASMHAARLYVSLASKGHLVPKVAPQIIIIDECHHAATDNNLAGINLQTANQVDNKTYLAAYQMLSGLYWPQQNNSPELAVLMSATPFRSQPQFINLLRLLTNNVTNADGKTTFDAFQQNVDNIRLRQVIQNDDIPATVAWRRQTDPGVRSWQGNKIFPNLTIIRPHQVPENDPYTPRLEDPSQQFLDLIKEIKQTFSRIARAHGKSFGGFASAQLEKKLTSSSIAGACTIFTWAVRRCNWRTQDDFKNDGTRATNGLRRLIRLISKRIAKSDGHNTVSFPSDGFDFPASVLSKDGYIKEIHTYSKQLRESYEDGEWVATGDEICEVVSLAERLLGVAADGQQIDQVQDIKMNWLNQMLNRHLNDRFILFTESLQTCETLKNALGTKCEKLVGSMSREQRIEAVEALSNPRRNVRVLVATSAADEGIDLQIASKVIHWDLSSSPATLMQRNGRAARLGQVKDVTAYYLIIRGTHEDKRDSSLQDKFAALGIADEALKSRILGSLSEEQEKRLEEAIEQNDDQTVQGLLQQAKDDNETMDRELQTIRKTLEPAQALSRLDLEERLKKWKKIGVPGNDIKIGFNTINWQRPNFDNVNQPIPMQSTIANLSINQVQQPIAFDPEFLLFGPRPQNNNRPHLAGIAPWLKNQDRHNIQKIKPYRNDDLLGIFLQKMVRLKQADFMTIPADLIANKQPEFNNAKWLLFCTHPLREAENMLPQKLRPYLTFYAFGELDDGIPAEPINPEGANAEEVNIFINMAEELAISENGCKDWDDGDQDQELIQSAKKAGLILNQWIENKTKFGDAALGQLPQYFIPVPVCLVSILPTNN
jgi:hypothetical protein